MVIGLYLLKVSAYIAAFYIPFAIVFKRMTFFTINRLYLLVGLILSFALPFYTNVSSISSYLPSVAPLIEPVVAESQLLIGHSTEPSNTIDIATILLIVYIVGILVRCISLFISLNGVWRLIRGATATTFGNTKVIMASTPIPFSFFKLVVVPKASQPNEVILEHERTHVCQCHWVDLVIMELASIALWFNAMIYLYRRNLKQQHEYLADRATVKNGIDPVEYLMAIRRQVEIASTIPLSSEFYFESIKKRIHMLTKRTTSAYGLSTYAIALPLIIFLLTSFSSRKYFGTSLAQANQDLQFGLPIAPGEFKMETGYGERMHPVLHVKRLHTGIDLTAKEGVSVLAAEDGIVVRAEMAESWGNLIIVQHDNTYSTSYSHMKSMSVKSGDKIQKGQLIGLVGHTGLSQQDHLHFEIIKNGKAIDPIDHLPALK